MVLIRYGNPKIAMINNQVFDFLSTQKSIFQLNHLLISASDKLHNYLSDLYNSTFISSKKSIFKNLFIYLRELQRWGRHACTHTDLPFSGFSLPQPTYCSTPGANQSEDQNFFQVPHRRDTASNT